jgi:hypothetical protein
MNNKRKMKKKIKMRQSREKKKNVWGLLKGPTSQFSLTAEAEVQQARLGR